jgi:hypothetical protein
MLSSLKNTSRFIDICSVHKAKHITSNKNHEDGREGGIGCKYRKQQYHFLNKERGNGPRR